MAAKKKRQTCTITSNKLSSNDHDHSVQEYHLKPTYKELLDELKEACQKGDNVYKLIDSLAPQMAAILRERKQLEAPDVSLEDITDNMHTIPSKQDANIVMDDFISDAK